MKILVATDFSEGAEHAGKYAIQLAAQIDAELVFFHAYHPKTLKSLPEEMATVLREKGEFSAQKYFLRYLKHLRAELAEVVAIHPVLKAGKPDISLLQYANSSEVDLVVMGTGKASSLSRRVLGNTTTSVLNQAHRPVLMVPSAASWQPIKHIVYGTSFQEEAGRVPPGVACLAEAAHAHVSCLFVKTTTETGKKVREPVLERTFRLQEDPSNQVFFYSLRHRSVSGGLKDFSDMYQADLLSVLAPRRHPLRRWFSPTMARNLLNHTQRPLLVSFQGN